MINEEPEAVVNVPEPAITFVAPKSIVEEAPTASVAFTPVVKVPAPLMVCVDEPLRLKVPADEGLKFKVEPEPTVILPFIEWPGEVVIEKSTLQFAPSVRFPFMDKAEVPVLLSKDNVPD